MKNKIKKLWILFSMFTLLLALSPQPIRAAETSFSQQLSAFPSSYRPAIRKLHAAHPNWVFQAMNTRLSWNNVLQNEFYPARNLIESTNIVSWKSASPGNYTSSRGWIVKSDPNWVQASQGIIKHYLDPRNFLTESGIYQFEVQTYNGSYQNLAGVKAILKGSFMDGAKVSTSLTYAQAFVKIGKALGVSPYLLASRVRQEQGAGDSDLISGKVKGYKGYYNYYNIEASGETRADIIKNGMTEAKKEGWNTRYKALYGGSKKVANLYIKQGQDTFYLQKFDVDDTAFGMYWHQYMQNLQAAESESRRIGQAYEQMGLTNSAFVFKIPVYETMPASACGKPAADLFPTSLTSIKATNYHTIQIRWNMVPWASGYRIYRSEKKKGGYKLAGTVQGRAGISYRDTTAEPGVSYYYKVRTFLTVDAGASLAKASGTMTAVTSLKAPQIVKIRANGTKRLLVNWSTVSGADGYRVYRATSENGKYTAIKTVAGKGLNTFSDAGRKTGVRYYYKVKAFRWVKGKRVFSVYSGVKYKQAK